MKEIDFTRIAFFPLRKLFHSKCLIVTQSFRIPRRLFRLKYILLFIQSAYFLKLKSVTKDIEAEAINENIINFNQFALLNRNLAYENFSDKQLLVELLTFMIYKELPSELRFLSSAYERKDFAAVAAVAHKMKGSAVYLGTERIEAVCRRLEECDWEKQKTLFNKLYLQTLTICEETITYVHHWLKEQDRTKMVCP